MYAFFTARAVRLSDSAVHNGSIAQILRFVESFFCVFVGISHFLNKSLCVPLRFCGVQASVIKLRKKSVHIGRSRISSRYLLADFRRRL